MNRSMQSVMPAVLSDLYKMAPPFDVQDIKKHVCRQSFKHGKWGPIRAMVHKRKKKEFIRVWACP